MAGLFGITLLGSVVILIAGLVKPAIFQRLVKTIPARKSIVLVGLGAVFASFIGMVFTIPPVEKTTAPDTAQKITTELEQIVQEPAVKSTISATNTATIVTPKNPPFSTISSSPKFTYYFVSSVVDGDTVKVNIAGKITTLRLIGMDTPETVDPRKPVQCFGKEASNKAKELLVGKKVRIEKDPTQGELDKYGRTLAYIYREDGLFFNKSMIEQGYAHEYTYNTPYKYQTEFKTAQKAAQVAQRGLWSPDTCNGDTTASANQTTPTPAPTPSPTPVPTPTPQTPVESSAEIKYYTSSRGNAKNYYPADCEGWKSLSKTYLKGFSTLEALLAAYPGRTLSAQCQ